MPYVPEEKRKYIQGNIYAAETPGDLNYLITLAILEAWKSNPHYEMIHGLKKMYVIDPKHNSFLNNLRDVFANSMTVSDIYTAAACAYAEFEARIVPAYEKKKRDLNGDLPEYVEALAKIEELK